MTRPANNRTSVSASIGQWIDAATEALELLPPRSPLDGLEETRGSWVDVMIEMPQARRLACKLLPHEQRAAVYLDASTKDLVGEEPRVVVTMSPELLCRVTAAEDIDDDLIDAIREGLTDGSLRVDPVSELMSLASIAVCDVGEATTRRCREAVEAHVAESAPSGTRWPLLTRGDDDVPIDGFGPPVLLSLAEELVSSGSTAGIQIYARTGTDVVVDLAAGWASATTPMERDAVLPWGCCSKLVLSLLYWRAWARGLTEPDRTVASDLDGFGTAGKEQTTYAELLTHTSGVVADPGLEDTYTGRGMDRATVLAAPRTSPAGEVNYSTIWSWSVLAMALEAIENISIAELAWRHVFTQTDRTQVIYGSTETELQAVGRIVPTWYEYGGSMVYLPISAVGLDRDEAAFAASAGKGAAAALAGLASTVATWATSGTDEVDPAVVRSALSPWRPAVADSVMVGAPTAWGLGVMCDFSGYGQLSEAGARPLFGELVGHIGLGGTGSWWHEKSDTVIAVIVNGARRRDTARRREARLLAALSDSI